MGRKTTLTKMWQQRWPTGLDYIIPLPANSIKERTRIIYEGNNYLLKIPHAIPSQRGALVFEFLSYFGIPSPLHKANPSYWRLSGTGFAHHDWPKINKLPAPCFMQDKTDKRYFVRAMQYLCCLWFAMQNTTHPGPKRFTNLQKWNLSTEAKSDMCANYGIM